MRCIIKELHCIYKYSSQGLGDLMNVFISQQCRLLIGCCCVNSLHPGIFFMIFCCLPMFFFKIDFLEKRSLSGIPSEYETGWIKISTPWHKGGSWYTIGRGR